MKTVFSALMFLLPGLSFADLAVYNGVEATHSASSPNWRPARSQFIEVVDLANSQMVVITVTGGWHAAKTFSIGATQAVVKTDVLDAHGRVRTLMVLAQADTTTDATTNVTSVTSLLQVGTESQVLLKTGAAKVAVARNLDGSGTLVTTAGTAAGGAAIAATLSDVRSSLSLQEATSRVSNDAGDTLAAAVARIQADLLAKGYADVTGP